MIDLRNSRHIGHGADSVTFKSFPSREKLETINNGGNKIAAIKAVRKFSGLGLKEAKTAVDELQAGSLVTLTLLPGTAEDNALRDFVGYGAVFYDPELLAKEEAQAQARAESREELIANMKRTAILAIESDNYPLANSMVALLRRM